jgi:hypothetical protein
MDMQKYILYALPIVISITNNWGYRLYNEGAQCFLAQKVYGCKIYVLTLILTAS